MRRSRTIFFLIAFVLIAVSAHRVSADIVYSDLSLTEGNAWVGFTARTFNSWENHDVLDWSVYPTAIPEPTAAIFCSLLGLGMSLRRHPRRPA